MARGILGRKLGMTQLFVDGGKRVPVTVIEAGPCFVVQKKSVQSDGYSALQLGFEPKTKNRKRPEIGHAAKAGQGVFRNLREFATDDSDETPLGAKVTVGDAFAVGDKVRITGVSKGKGYQGVVKRHGFGGGRITHGSKFHREQGSIGMHTWPAKVLKGKRMSGQMGNERVTVRNVVVEIDAERNLLLVTGSVPGPATGLLLISKA